MKEVTTDNIMLCTVVFSCVQLVVHSNCCVQLINACNVVAGKHIAHLKELAAFDFEVRRPGLGHFHIGPVFEGSSRGRRQVSRVVWTDCVQQGATGIETLLLRRRGLPAQRVHWASVGS